MQNPPQPVDFPIKQILPNIEAGAVSGDKLSSTYELVEKMQFIYVRVAKAKDLPGKGVTSRCDPYVEVKLANYKGVTRHVKKNNPEWNEVFAFSKDIIQGYVLEVFVKHKDVVVVNDLIGRVIFDINKIPERVPPGSPLAPQWYRLEDRKGNKVKGELMLAVWMGTQADEAFPDALHSDAAPLYCCAVANTRSHVYLSPKLWYVRVNVIEAQNLVPGDESRLPEVYVKADLGNQTRRTLVSPSKTINPIWDEDLMFVAAEPFEESLVLSVEDRVGSNITDETLGSCTIPLQVVQRRLDHKPVNSTWHNLEKHVIVDGEEKETEFSSRIHLRICLEGGYHVFDDSTDHSSDLRPAAEQLWRPSIGILELGILSARGLVPRKAKDGPGTMGAYCVVKYGQKWVRTRTIVDNIMPRWNEQYTWEVYDPCTFITIGVFDNGIVNGCAKEERIGKVRIRVSTLEADRVYSHSYPLLLINSSGVKKTGEVQLALRFKCTTSINMLHMYSHPLLPKMHHIHPLSKFQVDMLRLQAVHIVSMRLSRAKQPLRSEVVHYMLDHDDVYIDIWCWRRGRGNFFRIMEVLSRLIAVGKWFDQIRNWRNPITTILVHILFVIYVVYLELILPTVFLSLFLIGIWNYLTRPMHPPHMDTLLADETHPDELNEEFDTFPTSQPPDIVRMRYDRLRCVGGRLVTEAGKLAMQGERLCALISWKDPIATTLFIIFCFIAAIVLYLTPFRVAILLAGLYFLRHPWLRHKFPPVPLYFFRRLPSESDYML